jgi:hypothetical protein
MSTDTQSPSRISGLQPSIDPVREELRCYDEHLRDMHGLLPGTRRAYLRIAGRLLRQRFGHETPATTHQYIEADLAMKERALAKLHDPDTALQRYRAPDSLISFLKAL